MGSPLYMSPEALKRNIYSVKNDIWSIGIMCFELLHGETPWECKTEKELMDKMVKVPVRFRDSLNISEQTKRFIAKCLEVNEDQRMSLADLRDWNRNNSYDSLKDGMNSLNRSLELVKKANSSKEHGILGELTNRVSSRSQSNLTYHSNTLRDHSAQNAPSKTAKNSVEANNNALILEINLFRLLYKIYEKLRKHCSEERELLNAVGNEAIRRVNELASVVCPDKENLYAGRSELGLLDQKNYLNEELNPSIKKYKSVVKEYQKKYTQEISVQPQGRQVSAKSLMRETLAKGKLIKESLSTEEMIMVYWMIEFATLQDSVKKEYIDGVIDPKSQVLSRNYLLDRIKLI